MKEVEDAVYCHMQSKKKETKLNKSELEAGEPLPDANTAEDYNNAEVLMHRSDGPVLAVLLSLMCYVLASCSTGPEV